MQVNNLNRIDKWLRFFARILVREIPGKRAARRLEKQYIKDYIEKYGERPRGNPND
jgi:cation diffusion facilitator CzcD-associated flavoprotein CzcO